MKYQRCKSQMHAMDPNNVRGHICMRSNNHSNTDNFTSITPEIRELVQSAIEMTK